MAVYVIQQDIQYIGKPKPDERKSYYYGYNNDKPEIDKSGFNITEARNELYCKLKQYKKEKRAKEAAAIDYSQDIVEIEKSFADLKTEIIMCITKADTVEEYRDLVEVIDYKLTWLVSEIKDVKKCSISKSFSSIDSAYKSINSIKAKIERMKSKLHKEDVA